jgi:hypothetical protein
MLWESDRAARSYAGWWADPGPDPDFMVPSG